MNPITMCEHNHTSYRIRLYRNHRRRVELDPKWLPHVQKMCVNCGKHIRFEEQTEALRLKLDGNTLVDIDYQGIKEERTPKLFDA